MRKGLTLIELVITVALIAILVGIYFVVSNPGNQLASARNSRRAFDLQTIMNAVRLNIADLNNGQFNCSSGQIPTTTTNMASAAGNYNIAPCIVPTYISALPFDPSATSSYYNSASDYNTGYAIVINTSGTVTISAPRAELGKTVSVSR